jgi:LEA14-like dessication related protein
MRNGIVAGLIGLAVITTACSELGQQLAERIAVTQLQYALEKVELKRADIPLLAANPSADLLVTVKATNPNTVAAALDRMTFDLFLEGTKVGTGVMSGKLSVPAGGSQSAPILVTVPYGGLPTAALSALTARKATVRLQGTSSISTPLGELPVPVELQQTVTF